MDKDTEMALLDYVDHECGLVGASVKDLIDQAQAVIRFFMQKLEKEEPTARQTIYHLNETINDLEAER